MVSKYVFSKHIIKKSFALLGLLVCVCPSLLWINTAAANPVNEILNSDKAALESPILEPVADNAEPNSEASDANAIDSDNPHKDKPEQSDGLPTEAGSTDHLNSAQLDSQPNTVQPPSLQAGRAQVNTNASSVYAAYEEAVYQLRIIELESNSQSSLGTGFLVSNALNQLKIATNYHVVSSTLFNPKKYRIEFNFSGFTEPQILVVSSIDVVNDLALLEPQKPLQLPRETIKAFTLQPTLPPKGETLYSLGNPHNIGMTVVEGNYNGLVEHRFVDQIHFTGAVNSGMSGGPVVNDAGKVVGVNVATAGNQIGFLVPAKALDTLIESDAQARQFELLGSQMPDTSEPASPAIALPSPSILPPVEAPTLTDVPLSDAQPLAESTSNTESASNTMAASITTAFSQKPTSSTFWRELASQIDRHTSAMVGAALEDDWKTHQMGKVNIQSSNLPWLDCWGDSYDDKEKKTETISRGCHSGANIYLNQNFNTGFIEYEFMLFDAPTWPTTSVYRRLAADTGRASPANYGPKKHLGDFTCSDQQVRNDAGLSARISFCQRQYKNMPSLYDVFYMAVSTDQPKTGAMSHYTLAGVSRETSQRFLAHFIEVLSWP